MDIQIGFTDEDCNTSYATLVALWAHYQRHNLFAPLKNVLVPMRKGDFAPDEKLLGVLLSILGGCETLSEFNPRLRHEQHLLRWLAKSKAFDQATLSRTLDALTLTNLAELRAATWEIWRPFSQVQHHDGRGYLWLDFDLSGLPCGPQAEASQKGYFADKKTSTGGN